MCKLADGFKLCTCGTISQEKTHWILKKANEANPIVIGMIREGFEVIKKYRWVQQSLNEHSCFDFEYTPEHGDRLIFNIIADDIKEKVTFKYVHNRHEQGWQIELIPNYKSKRIIASGLIR